MGIVFSLIGASQCVWAGSAASQWVVVVNGDSLLSRTIANHYCVHRNIPMHNVVVLHGIPTGETLPIDAFRDKILEPLIREIEARGISAHLQGIAYSAGFPTAIQLDSDLAGAGDRPSYLTPVGSINGMTYLFRYVRAKSPLVVSLETNGYAGRSAASMVQAFVGTQEQRTEWESLLRESKHELAAQLLDEVAKSHRDSHPVLYQSAQQWAQADKPAIALQRLEKAIRRGWHYRNMLEHDAAFDNLHADPDFQRLVQRCEDDDARYSSPRGFDARLYYCINTIGQSNPKHGVSYLLSAVLSLNGETGNTEMESIRQLRRSIDADFTYPKGAFVFARTSDVRTTAREPNFEVAIERLKQSGFEAKVIATPLPTRGERCAGVMIGTPEFDWGKSGCELLPGAIADNLTSLGGVMNERSQTKLTEFLRHGAAMSSGTVTEPYAIQQKFPHPAIHVHYTSGLTAAEAFYSSVTGPYQLLMVGDPLCQPYAIPPIFDLDGIENNANVPPKIAVQIRSQPSKQISAPERFAWMVDGKMNQLFDMTDKLNIAFRPTDIGAHELRLMATAAPPIESKFERSFWVTVGEPREQLQLSAPVQWSMVAKKPLRIALRRGENTTPIVLKHDSETIASFPADRDFVDIDFNKVGSGPIRLQASTTDSQGRQVRSLPIVVEIVR